MRYMNLEDSEVFSAFAEIAEKEGLLNKKADYIYPDYDIGAKNSELDLGFTALATKNSGNLYGVTHGAGEDLVHDAHPKSVTTDLSMKPAGDLAKVENLIETHKVMEDIAKKKPTGKYAMLAQKLASLADKLDQRGFTNIAMDIETALNKIAADFGYDMYQNEPSNNVEMSPANVMVDQTQERSNDVVMPEQMMFGTVDPIVQKHMEIQNLINHFRAKSGKPAIPVTGKFDAPFAAALKELGIAVGSYKTWNELKQLISNRSVELGKQHFQDVQPNVNPVAQIDGPTPLLQPGIIGENHRYPTRPVEPINPTPPRDYGLARTGPNR